MNNLVCNFVGKILAIVPKKSEDCAQRSLNKLAKNTKVAENALGNKEGCDIYSEHRVAMMAGHWSGLEKGCAGRQNLWQST